MCLGGCSDVMYKKIKQKSKNITESLWKANLRDKVKLTSFVVFYLE